nr:E3 ubiquitin-protein ligase TRIM37-like [Aedes albopictus]
MPSSGFLRIPPMEQSKEIAKNWLDSKINTDELFACAICHCAISAEHPIHCPQCSNLFCATCIDQWFAAGGPRPSVVSSVKRCPCCQAKVTMNQFTYCRVYQEVREVIDSLHNSMEELIQQLRKPVILCEKHNKELTLFCQECDKCICVKCVLVDRHRGHIDLVLELDDAREKLKNTILRENKFLAKRLDMLNNVNNRLKTRENDMHQLCDSIVNEMNITVDAMIEKMHEDKDERIEKYIAPVKAAVMRQQKEVESIIQQSFALANEETCPDVLVKTCQMIRTIKTMNYKEFPVDQHHDINFTNPITPPPLKVLFSVPCFSSRILRSCTVFSVPQSFEGFMLQLKCYRDSGENVIKLCLRILEGYDIDDIKVVCYPSCYSIRGGEPLVRCMDLKKGEDNTVLEFEDFAAMGSFLDTMLDELVIEMRISLWGSYYAKCAHKDWCIKKLSGLKEVMENIQKSE